MLPIDIADLSTISVVGTLRVLGNAAKTAYRIEPDAPEHEIARPLADLFFGESEAIVSVTDEVIAAVLADRGFKLPQEVVEVGDEALLAKIADLEKALDESSAEITARTASRDEALQAVAVRDSEIADLKAEKAEAEKLIDQDGETIKKLEADLAEARSRIPVVAPVAADANAPDAGNQPTPGAEDKTPPVGTSTV